MHKLTHKQDRFLVWLNGNKHLINLEKYQWDAILNIICDSEYAESERASLNRFATSCKNYYEKYLEERNLMIQMAKAC